MNNIGKITDIPKNDLSNNLIEAGSKLIYLDHDVCLRIVHFMENKTLECFIQASISTKKLVLLVNEERNKKISGIKFGQLEWLSWYNFYIPYEPLLPHKIIEILEDPCPLSKSSIVKYGHTYKVKDTHIFTLIPQGMSKKLFGEISPINKGYNIKSNDEVINFLDKPAKRSCWVIMTKDVINSSRGLDFKAQLNLVATFSIREFKYRAPKSLEAIVSILTRKISSGECFFNEFPWTYTRCLDVFEDKQVVIGGCGSNGICVSTEFYIRVIYGMSMVLEW